MSGLQTPPYDLGRAAPVIVDALLQQSQTKKEGSGMWWAIILILLVLGSVGAYYLAKKNCNCSNSPS